MRWIITAQNFEIRKTYRPDEQKYTRYATIAGTSNQNTIITDPEFNRRIVPIEITEIDLDVFLAIDKNDLFAEIYEIWQTGKNYELSVEDINELKMLQFDYTIDNAENELICKHFKAGEENAEFLTASEIANILNDFYPSISVKPENVGREMRKLGFTPIAKKINGKSVRGYFVVKN